MRSNLPIKRFNESNEEVDLTPMLDVVFILLIFFIVTAVFIKERGVEISRPSSNLDTPQELGGPIIVRLDSAGKYWIEGEHISPLALRARMQAHNGHWPTEGAVIVADPNVDMETFVFVLDSARQVYRHNEIVLEVNA